MREDHFVSQIISGALGSAVDEMSVSLMRSAFSTNIKTRADFSCAFFDADCKIIAQAFAQAVHLATMVHIVPSTIEAYGVKKIGPGDAIVVNDVHRVGGTHLNDVTLISPVFFQDALVGYVANIAHHIDIGSGTPGSLPLSTNIYQDGLIIPPSKLVEGGKIQEDIFGLIVANVRGKKENAGDFRAQVAANATGIRKVDQLYRRYGKEVMKGTMRAMLDYTERRARKELETLPHGVFADEDYADDDGLSEDPIRIKVKITIDAKRLVFDFSGTAKQVRGPMNAHYGVAGGIGAYVLKALLPGDVAVNAGLYRCFEVIAPKGTVLNAQYPASVVGFAEIGTRALEVAFRAMAKAVPTRVAAQGKTTMVNISFGGFKPKSREEYVYYETIAGGYGARPNEDGPDAVQALWQNTENAPVEEFELAMPVMILRYQLIQDSEGAGKYRGGLGLRRDYLFKDHEASFSSMTDVAKFPPRGEQGGEDARGLRIIRNPGIGSDRHIGTKITIRLEPNEVVSVQTPGGGGYGKPTQRAVSAALDDLLNEKISLERAVKIYGVPRKMALAVRP